MVKIHIKLGAAASMETTCVFTQKKEQEEQRKKLFSFLGLVFKLPLFQVSCQNLPLFHVGGLKLKLCQVWCL